MKLYTKVSVVNIRKIVILIFIISLYSFIFPGISYASESVNWTDNNQFVGPFKDWTITFSQPVNLETLNDDNVYVYDADNNWVFTIVVPGLNNNDAIVMCPEEGYNPGVYYLHVSNAIKSETGSFIKNPVVMKFIVTN